MVANKQKKKSFPELKKNNMKSATQIFRIMLQKFIMLFKVNLYASDGEN